MTGKPVPRVSEVNRALFDGCANGELRVRRCHVCNARFNFAHWLCPACWSADIGWERATGFATVTHFTVVHQAPAAAFQADAPYVLALVELDEGVRMMTNIVGVEPERVAIGMRVRVAFEARGEVHIPIFLPA